MLTAAKSSLTNMIKKNPGKSIFTKIFEGKIFFRIIPTIILMNNSSLNIF